MRSNHLAALLSLLCLLFLSTSCKKDDNPGADILDVFVHNPTDGDIMIAPFKDGDHSSGVLLNVDKNGNILKRIPTGGEALNFIKWNYEGKTRYSYNQYIYKNEPIAVIYSQAVVLDENFNEIRRFNLLPFNGRTNTDPNGLDSHDFILLSDDHYIALGAVEQQVNNIPAALHPVANTRVIATVIQEVNNGQVVWEWNSADFPEFYTNSMQSNDFGSNDVADDYMHCNSICIDPADNNLVVSFRSQDEVVKLKRNTGEIMWRLGGKISDFPVTANQHFLRQHDATVSHDEGKTRIMLVDNGLRGTREYSRILEIQIDELNKSISNFKEFAIPNTFIEFMGSVQKRGDTYFIGGGSAKTVLEYNYVTGEKLFEIDLENPTYRAFKY